MTLLSARRTLMWHGLYEMNQCLLGVICAEAPVSAIQLSDVGAGLEERACETPAKTSGVCMGTWVALGRRWGWVFLADFILKQSFVSWEPESSHHAQKRPDGKDDSSDVSIGIESDNA